MSDLQAIDPFLRKLAIERNLAVYTLAAYRSDLQDLAAFHSRRFLRDLSLQHIQDYVASLQKRGLRDSTIRRRLATLRVFYGVLEAEGTIPESPLHRVRHRYTVLRRLPRVIPLSQVEAMLKTAYRKVHTTQDCRSRRRARALRDLAVLDLLFATGIRSGEAVALDVKDLDLERRNLQVRGKGRRERRISLPGEELLSNLGDYLAMRDCLNPTDDALFLNNRGFRLHVQSVGLIFRRTREEAGLPCEFSPHCLRHTMATMLVENGADLRSTQDILGHSNIRTTEIYVAVSRNRHESVMARFNARNLLRVRGPSYR